MAKSENRETKSQSRPGLLKPSGDQLEISHTVDPPLIANTLEKVSAAVAQAKKARLKTHRRHICRVCRKPYCTHFQRRDLDTGEEFDTQGPDLDK